MKLHPELERAQNKREHSHAQAQTLAKIWLSDATPQLVDRIERAIAQAVAAEREACAKIIDENVEGSSGGNKVLMTRCEGNLSGTAYAAAIRARST
jgi:hypothetical protein